MGQQSRAGRNGRTLVGAAIVVLVLASAALGYTVVELKRDLRAQTTSTMDLRIRLEGAERLLQTVATQTVVGASTLADLKSRTDRLARASFGLGPSVADNDEIGSLRSCVDSILSALNQRFSSFVRC